jgi:hypothetical protein
VVFCCLAPEDGQGSGSARQWESSRPLYGIRPKASKGLNRLSRVLQNPDAWVQIPPSPPLLGRSAIARFARWQAEESRGAAEGQIPPSPLGNSRQRRTTSMCLVALPRRSVSPARSRWGSPSLPAIDAIEQLPQVGRHIPCHATTRLKGRIMARSVTADYARTASRGLAHLSPALAANSTSTASSRDARDALAPRSASLTPFSPTTSRATSPTRPCVLVGSAGTPRHRMRGCMRAGSGRGAREIPGEHRGNSGCRRPSGD